MNRLLIFASALHDASSVMGSRKELLDSLVAAFDCETVYVDSTDTAIEPFDGRTLCFIATGGTEELYRSHIDSVPAPVTLIADGLHNSLAASLEIRTYLAQRGVSCRILSAEEAVAEAREAVPADAGAGAVPCPSEPVPAAFGQDISDWDLSEFEGLFIGLAGGESPWLISSGIDRRAVEDKYRMKFRDVPLDLVREKYEATSEDDPGVEAAVLSLRSCLSEDRTLDDLTKAARMYIALREICDDNGFDGLTVKCFDLLDSCGTTACLALALLNDEDIVCGCEGDIPALWTMIYAKRYMGRPAFMCNPASLCREDLSLELAHCTLPLSMTTAFSLPSHFESGIGIGIRGTLPEGRYALLKISGDRLQYLYRAEGEIVANTCVPQRCRTQVRFRFDNAADFDLFLDTAKGNHVVLVRKDRLP
ncbi:MAG: hypothetical protein MJY60_02175 [Bacteroidales bacterium]|nr:hypothetical protein [Bacteroidales bacterium]